MHIAYCCTLLAFQIINVESFLHENKDASGCVFILEKGLDYILEVRPYFL